MIKRRKNIAILVLTFVLSTTFPYTVRASFPNIKRLGGSDRYDTCIKVAQDGWSSSYYAVIACGENYPDALSSVPLAKKYDAPILLTYSNFMPSKIMDEIKQLHVGKVFLIGGQGSINSSIEKQLQNQGIQTERLAGADRYETSVKIAEKFGKTEAITVATGEDYADALSIGPAAAAMGVPVLLVPKNYVPDVTKKYIRNLNTIKNSEYDNSSNSSSNSSNNSNNSNNANTSSGIFRDYHVFVMGDSNVVTDNVVDEFQGEGNTVERIEGKDQYYRNINAIGRFVQKASATSTQNSNYNDDNNKQTQYFVKGDMLSLDNLYLASGGGFADALSGAALAAKTKSPIILSGSSNSGLVKDFILSKIPNYGSDSVNPEYLTVLGGEGVMPGAKVSEIFGNIAFDNAVGFKSDSDSVKFPDKAFEKVIRDKLNIHDRNIYFSDVKGITSLDLTNQNILSISGIENLVHLKSLNLSYNQIKDISPIVRLDELENLNLSHNNIEDISYISNLVNLKELNVSDNRIEDLNHSRKMYKEENETEYEETSDNVFKKLKYIVSLDLSNSILDDYSSNRNRITSLSNLKDMTSLVSLNLNGNDVGSLDSLKDLTNLTTLKLSHADLYDLDFIEKLTGITYLDISYNSSIDSDDLKPLKKLINLKYLNASNDKIDDVSLLSGLTHLTTLYIEDNPIKDYTPILDISKSLYYKDFDVSSIIGTSSYDSDITIDAQIKDQISNFQSMYSYGDYTKLRYRKLYHAYDLGTYDSQLQDLYKNRNWITYEISLSGMTQGYIDNLKNQLNSINYNVEEMSKKDSMNKKVKDLEAQLLYTSKPIEKEKLIGKINYVYADYRYDYYRNLVQKYSSDMEKIKEQIQEASYETANYSSNKDIKNLQYALDEIQKDSDLASQKIIMYQNYKDFFNAVNAVLEEI